MSLGWKTIKQVVGGELVENHSLTKAKILPWFRFAKPQYKVFRMCISSALNLDVAFSFSYYFLTSWKLLAMKFHGPDGEDWAHFTITLLWLTLTFFQYIKEMMNEPRKMVLELDKLPPKLPIILLARRSNDFLLGTWKFTVERLKR